MNLPEDLTIVDVVGTPSAEDIISAKSQTGFGSTRKLLWDFSHADISRLDMDGFIKIGKAYKAFDGEDKTVAVAMLVKATHEISLLKLYREISTRVLGRTDRIHITTSRQDAVDSLNRRVPKLP